SKVLPHAAQSLKEAFSGSRVALVHPPSDSRPLLRVGLLERRRGPLLGQHLVYGGASRAESHDGPRVFDEFFLRGGPSNSFGNPPKEGLEPLLDERVEPSELILRRLLLVVDGRNIRQDGAQPG